MHSEKVPYYIIDLLQQVPSVYVTGLGRFDAIFHSASIDPQKSQIIPPRIEPGFEVASHDSEDMLPLYMHYVSGVEKEDAINSIKAFVKHVHDSINSGSSYAIEKFGSFSRSGAGNIYFTPDWDAFNLSFIGLETISLHPATEYQPEPERHITEFVSEPVPTASKSAVETPIETNWISDDETRETVKENEEPIVVAGPVISDSTSKLWWTILASALALITILCGYLAWDILNNNDNINQLMAITNDSLANSTPDIIIVDSLEFIEEELPEDTVVSPVEPVVEEPVPDEPQCFVVVGAFTNADNISRMENRLAGMGYKVEKIKGGALTRVAISTSCDRANLQKVLNEARTSINPEAWIY